MDKSKQQYLAGLIEPNEYQSHTRTAITALLPYLAYYRGFKQLLLNLQLELTFFRGEKSQCNMMMKKLGSPPLLL